MGKTAKIGRGYEGFEFKYFPKLVEDVFILAVNYVVHETVQINC